MSWTELPVVAFDTETTGLNPWTGDRIIEFAAVRFRLDPGGSVREDAVERIHFLFNPGIPIPREVRDLTGIQDADVAKAPPFAEQAKAVRAILEGAVTVAHNYAFDHSVLMAEFDRLGLTWPSPRAEIDTLDVCRRHQPEGGSLKLGELAARLGVRLDGAHRAVNDAEACGRVFLVLARRHDAPPELEGLLEWADAIGHPPPGGPIRLLPDGRVVFAEPPLEGEEVEHHPDHLAWMILARARRAGAWQMRYPDSVRAWAARWLRVRAAGRAIQGGRHFGADDWALDSCVLADP